MKALDLFTAAGHLACVHRDIPAALPQAPAGMVAVHKDDGSPVDGSIPVSRSEYVKNSDLISPAQWRAPIGSQKRVRVKARATP